MRRALAAAIALMLVVPALASAMPSERRGGDRGPSARVQTTGSGMITVAGRLSVNGLIPDRGVVVVKDRRGDATAYLAGEPLELERRGRTRVRRASGILYVTGSSVAVTVLGEDLSFSIAGNGRALFAGSGVFQIDSGPVSPWTGEWMRIPPSSDTPGRGRQRRCANCSSSAAPRR
jgi:hypothetical protein